MVNYVCEKCDLHHTMKQLQVSEGWQQLILEHGILNSIDKYANQSITWTDYQIIISDQQREVTTKFWINNSVELLSSRITRVKLRVGMSPQKASLFWASSFSRLSSLQVCISLIIDSLFSCCCLAGSLSNSPGFRWWPNSCFYQAKKKMKLLVLKDY